MTKNTFKLMKDCDTDISYITRAEDELTKNHQEVDSDIISGLTKYHQEVDSDIISGLTKNHQEVDSDIISGLTKNHQEVDSDIISGYMPEMPGSKYCPVQSFLTYLHALDKKVEHLWQRPKFNQYPEDGKGVWYGPQRIEHNPLDTFITDVCKNVGLSDLGYANHNLRVTAIKNLK